MILPFVESAFFAYVGDIAAESRVESVELSQALEGLQAAEAALVAYRDDVALQAVLGMESFRDGLDVRQSAVHDATTTVEQAKQLASGLDLPPRERLMDMWPQLRPSERQRLLASAIDVVYVRRSGSGRRSVADRVKLVWRGENVHDLSGSGKSVPLRTETW